VEKNYGNVANKKTVKKVALLFCAEVMSFVLLYFYT